MDNHPSATNEHEIAKEQIADDSNSIRRMSATLSTFPWATDFLVKDINRILNDGCYRPFVEAVSSLEAGIDTAPANDAEAFRLHTVLCRVRPGTLSMPDAPVFRKPLPTVLCEVICCYRLYDVLYDLQEQDRTTPFENPAYPKQRLHAFLPPSQVWPLGDWVALLHKAKGTIETMSRYGPWSVELKALSTTGNAGPVTVHLLKELFVLSKNDQAVKILYNVVTAALHLACMLDAASSTGDRLAIPNLPSQQDEWKAQQHLTPEESVFFERFIRSSETQKIRHTLYGALLFSPLYLLMPLKLANNVWDQEKMVKLSKALGNTKPTVLVKTERLLWECVIQIAVAKERCYNALSNFISAVDWDELAMVSEADRGYFADDMSLPDVNSHLLSVEGETGLRASWTLASLRSLNASPNPDASREQHRAPHRGDDKVDAGPTLPDVTMGVGSLPSGSGTKDDATAKARIATSDVRRSSRIRELASAQEVTDPVEKDIQLVPKKRRERKGNSTFSRALKLIPFQAVRKGVYIQQVEVKPVKKAEVTFKMKARHRVRGEPITIFDTSGLKHFWTPEFHFQSDLDKFSGLYRHVEGEYVEGLPRYLSDPEKSRIRVIKHDDYMTLSVAQVQGTLRLQHIVITDIPLEQVVPTTGPVAFNEAGLRQLRNLESPITIQDQSIPVDQDHSVQMCTGTLDHVLASSRDAVGGIVNASSFPLPLSAIDQTAYSSDAEAWRVTEGLPFCEEDAVYPTGKMRWGLAATAGARSWIRIACNGLCTVIEPLCGRKLWLLYSPAEEYDDGIFGDIDQFFNEFNVTTQPDYWSVEAVYLQPGTRLIMRPNTPHAVFTTEHSIAVGGHFFSFANVQESVFGIVHAFCVDSLVTNAEHPKTRILLFRMLQYLYKFYVDGADPIKHGALHLPDLDAMDMFVGLASLCNYCILSNILDPRTYNFPDIPYGHPPSATHLDQRIQHDYNALSPSDRLHFSYIRGHAINLIHWVHSKYLFVDKAGQHQEFITIARTYLHQQVRAILGYKIGAEKKGLRGVPNCSSEDLRRQIELLFAEGMANFAGLSLTEVRDATSLSWTPELTPLPRGRPLAFNARDPQVLGTTKGDKMFHAGSDNGFRLNPISKKTSVDDDVEGEDEEPDDANHDADVEDTDSIDEIEDVVVGMLGAEEPMNEDGDNVQEGEDMGNDGGSDQAADYRDEEQDDTSASSSDWEYDNWEDKVRRRKWRSW